MITIADNTQKLIQEKCGIVALYKKTYEHLLPLALLAAGGVQHRGQQGAGIALQTENGLLRYTSNGLLNDIFTDKVLKQYDKRAKWAIVHCRYGTNGGYDKRNLQPCTITSSEGIEISVIHNGEFVATDKLRQMVSKKFPPDISDTYLFAQLLAETGGTSFEKRIIHALSFVKGAYSLIIGIGNKIYLARDEFGMRPLVIGHLNGKYIAASETHALDKIGATVNREVRRGEIVRIDESGISVVKRGLAGNGNFCDFEWAYFGRPNSLLPNVSEDGKYPSKWVSIMTFREKCGAVLADENPIKNADFVVGLPDSGVSVAIGYAIKLGIPYRQAIIRDHYDPSGNQRLFMRDDQKKKIQRRVLGKLTLVPDPKIWKGAVVVIGDDSIVRSNVSRNVTRAVLASGAKEVHWIVGFPPVTHPCHLGVSMRTKEELIASKYKSSNKKIAKSIGAKVSAILVTEAF